MSSQEKKVQELDEVIVSNPLSFWDAAVQHEICDFRSIWKRRLSKDMKCNAWIMTCFAVCRNQGLIKRPTPLHAMRSTL
jgi:hypothetical protein